MNRPTEKQKQTNREPTNQPTNQTNKETNRQPINQTNKKLGIAEEGEKRDKLYGIYGSNGIRFVESIGF